MCATTTEVFACDHTIDSLTRYESKKQTSKEYPRLVSLSPLVSSTTTG
jgi:hypothetical protein